MNEYLSGMDPGLRTPYGVPSRVRSGEDVFPLHRRLVERSQAAPDDEDLQELAVFFLRAAARLGEAGPFELLVGTVSHCHGALNRLVVGPEPLVPVP